jgi:hypothetical protein
MAKIEAGFSFYLTKHGDKQELMDAIGRCFLLE